MRHRILHPMCLAACVVVLMTAAYAQQSHWATPDDKNAKFMIDMERKWAEGVCTNNGVISELLAGDFQGTSTRGEHQPADGVTDDVGDDAERDAAAKGEQHRAAGRERDDDPYQRTGRRREQIASEDF